MVEMKVTFIKRIGWFIGFLVIAALACNAPLGGNGTPSPPPPATSAETIQPIQTPTITPTAGPGPATEETPTLLPTFTPIPVTPSLESTLTRTPTPTGTSPSSPNATPTEEASSGPLSFTYTIEWEVSSENPGIAIATVTMNATGGGGGYQYFRDDLPVDGPVFQYQWATCRGNPGSLRVDSADGQSARVDYFETPPCPATPAS